MFMIVLNILCHNLSGMNRPEGWVWTDQKWVRNVWAWVQIVWIWKTLGYKMTGKHFELDFKISLEFFALSFWVSSYDKISILLY